MGSCGGDIGSCGGFIAGGGGIGSCGGFISGGGGIGFMCSCGGGIGSCGGFIAGGGGMGLGALVWGILPKPPSLPLLLEVSFTSMTMSNS